jgi:hypothetical protein
MSYVRAVPASEIAEIQWRSTISNSRLAFLPRTGLDGRDPQPWQAYNPLTRIGSGKMARFAPVMLHYAINRPAGALWGESDLATTAALVEPLCQLAGGPRPPQPLSHGFPVSGQGRASSARASGSRASSA